MNEGVVDQGVAILIAVGGDVRHWFTGAPLTVTSSSGRTVVMLLFAVTAIGIVGPGVPLPVAMAGLLAFYTLLESGPLVIGPPQHWGVAFAALVCAVYLGSALKPWSGWRVAALIVLAALVALAQVLRQDASGVAYVVGAAMLVVAAIAALVDWRSGADGQHAGLRPLARRAIAGGVLLMAMNASAIPLERWLMSRQMGTPYGATPAIEHGSGWPLYLSLGYIPNPFNIAWRDPIGQLHADLMTSSHVSGNAAVHSLLMSEYLRIVVSEPWRLVENVAAKTARIHALATRRADPLPDVAVWQRPPIARYYKALPWLGVALVALLWWKGTPEMAAIAIVALALGAAASASALIVFPDYMGGVQGATVALALIVPAAIVSCWTDDAVAPGGVATLLARRVLTWVAVLAVGAALAAGAFVAVQWMRYRALRDETAARSPLEAIEDQQFRYAYVFNDLPVTRQGRLVAQLTGSSDPRIARAIDQRRGDQNLFRPEALVRTATQLHLIAWMGGAFHPPFPPFYQGRTDALFFICGECAPESTVNDFPFDSGWMFVSDLEWQGRYRMFSVPLNAKLKAARFFHVAAERVLGLDSSNSTTGLRSGPIASARVAY